jgi:hypothetical protein
MGYIKHHAIVVTSWNDALIVEAHAKAVEYCRLVTPLSETGVNGYRSFLIAPDGSKEGWGDSDLGDAEREAFIRWAEGQAIRRRLDIAPLVRGGIWERRRDRRCDASRMEPAVAAGRDHRIVASRRLWCSHTAPLPSMTPAPRARMR